jgi:hypothetical protein
LVYYVPTPDIKLTFHDQDSDLGVWLNVPTLGNMFLFLCWYIVIVLQSAFL